MIPRIVVGLGNPGEEYRLTRHNAGFHFIDHLLMSLPVTAHDKGRIAERWSVLVGEGEVTLVKPLTYMNRSGLAVRQLLESAPTPGNELLVVVDDLYLDAGVVRYRTGGSAGGQRGLASIMDALGTADIPRLRLGVGPCPADQAHADFVLGVPSPADQELLRRAVDKGAQALILAVRNQIPLVISP